MEVQPPPRCKAAWVDRPSKKQKQSSSESTVKLTQNCNKQQLTKQRRLPKHSGSFTHAAEHRCTYLQAYMAACLYTQVKTVYLLASQHEEQLQIL